MTVLYSITWAVIAAVIVWAIMRTRASAAMSHLEAEMRDEIAYWQDETSRARVQAAQVARDAAIRADAWKAGRDDVIAIMPLIVPTRDVGASSPPGDEETDTS
jgi:hypothetical protein